MDFITLARLPDSGIVTEAAALVQRASDARIFNHTLRTHYLATRYASRFEVEYDREQLALAALFHDIGLSPEHYTDDHAFIFRSLETLKGFLLERGYDPTRIPATMQAIDWHFNVLPRWDLGEVAGLLQIGAWMDVTGLRCWSIFEYYRESKKLFSKRGFFLHFQGCLFGQLVSPARALGLIAPGRHLPEGHYRCDTVDAPSDPGAAEVLRSSRL